MEVHTDTGRRLVLTGTGRSGGEGTVYEVAGTGRIVAKIFHPHRLSAELHDKLRVMAASAPDDPAWRARRHRSIAWVEHLLYADPVRTRFVGFTMPALDRATFREAHALYDPADRLARFGGAFTWRHLLTAATNLASSVAAVHAAGHRVGDLRETNVLVAPNALISLIDCDSFQVADPASARMFFCRVGSAEYLPPELHGVDFAADHDREASDRFALAVLVFRFLMNGVHPFQAIGRAVSGATTTEAKIGRGHFPYVRRRGVAPPDFAPPFEVVPPALRALFVRCFVEGHRRPADRPTPAAWFDALKAEATAVRTCRANPNHVHGGHLRRCPWCALPDDPFPRAGGRVRSPGAVVRRAPAAAGARASASAGARASAFPGASSIGLVRTVSLRRLLRIARALGPRAMVRATIAFHRSPRPWVTRRRAGWVLGMVALLFLVVSPVGHSAEEPRTRVVDWTARSTGPCPSIGNAPTGCRARWRFGPARLTEHRARRFFVLTSERARLDIEFSVRFGTEVPWIDHRAFDASLPQVCLGDCPERIEVRVRGTRGVLIDATGIAARSGPLPGSTRFTGSWTFDVSTLEGPVTLHYPGLEPIKVDLRAR